MSFRRTRSDDSLFNIAYTITYYVWSIITCIIPMLRWFHWVVGKLEIKWQHLLLSSNTLSPFIILDEEVIRLVMLPFWFGIIYRTPLDKDINIIHIYFIPIIFRSYIFMPTQLDIMSHSMIIASTWGEVEWKFMYKQSPQILYTN